MRTTTRLSTLLLASAFAMQVSAHTHTGYLHNTSIPYRNNDWMKFVPGDMQIRTLSLPGTHDSMAHYGGDMVQTQSLPLPIQLSAGIRALDLRLRHINNRFAIHHGIVYQHASFGDALNILRAFLKSSPSETVLVRVKEEHTPSGNTQTFNETFLDYYSEYQDIIWKGGSDNPTLNEVRGKVVFLQDFSGPRFGIDYDSFDIQDRYQLGSNWDLYGKWEAVEDHLWKAAASGKSSISYLSGSGGSFPYFVASGHSSPGTSAPRLATGLTTPGWSHMFPDFPRVDCFIGICTIAFEGTNVLTTRHLEWLLSLDYGINSFNYVGIVYADFPGQGLIDNTIKFNLPYCRKWSSVDKGTAGDVYRYGNPYTKQREYFRLKVSGRYGYFPTDQTSNGTWEYLGLTSKCR